MATAQKEFIADTIDRSNYAEGQTLDATSLNADAEQIANSQHLHNRYAHSGGVIAGLLSMVATPIDEKLRLCKLSPGAAIDNAGRLLLVGNDHPGVVITFDGRSDLNVWLKFVQIENSRRATSRGMVRCSEIPELIVVHASNDVNEINPSDAVFLGCFGIAGRLRVRLRLDLLLRFRVIVVVTVKVRVAARVPKPLHVLGGRSYVSAVGSRIDSPSGQSRILLGPEAPRDTRRFAVCYFDQREGSFKDAITWETTDAIHLKTQVNVTNKKLDINRNDPAVFSVGRQRTTTKNSDSRNREPKRPAVEFIGVSSNATKMSPSSIYLAEGKVDQQSFRELRISIPDPGEKNNPQRYRCSIGSARQCAHGPDLCLQTGFPRGILSVLADGSVEVHENLRVFTDSTRKRLGLIIQQNPSSELGDSKPPATVLKDVLAFEHGDPKCVIVDEHINLSGKLENRSLVAAHSLKIYVTVIKKDDATKTPLRFSVSSKKQLVKGNNVDLAALFTDSQTPPATLQFPVSGDFGSAPLVNLLILGVNDDNAIVQLQVEITPTPPT